jgi:hypothetical protein
MVAPSRKRDFSLVIPDQLGPPGKNYVVAAVMEIDWNENG